MTEIGDLDVLRPVLALALPAAAIARLPRGELGVPATGQRLSRRLPPCADASCLLQRPQGLYEWWAQRELHPLQARRHDIALWARQLAEQAQRSGKVQAPASIARRLSCLSSFYGYAVASD
ncbi:MAG: hypothetical protein M3401_15670 [Actinomycetota bacterium]|nr:hypothetical protein [Actinomycetota bacterium]